MTIPAHSPRYADFDHTSIDLIIDHPDLGTIPFTASGDDSEPLGQSLYSRAMSGEFGPIAPYNGPNQQAIQQSQARSQRNQRLAQLDALTGNPLRWAEFDDGQKATLAAYRQALLDVPQQAGFPAEIDWPVLPDI